MSKVKALLYCTKAKNNKEKLHRCLDEKWRLQDNNEGWVFFKDSIHFDGKILAECEIETEEWKLDKISFEELESKSCVSYNELVRYQPNYLLHISNLKVFDKPMKLMNSEINIRTKQGCEYVVDKAPQNMCNVIYKGERYVLISIQPQWLCKILNGEKTIEVRRKVLNCMKGEK